jgi:hypothetical protein
MGAFAADYNAIICGVITKVERREKRGESMQLAGKREDCAMRCL